MGNQVKETLENQNPATRLGNYATTGGPGRPKGLKNRFTVIKEQILEIWEEESGKEKFRELFKGNQRDFVKALEIIAGMFPKEPSVKVDVEQNNNGADVCQVYLIDQKDG